MSKEYDAIIAKTHTAEYSMHKYWARKPHNVLSYFISQIVPENGEVLDPFCGIHVDKICFNNSVISRFIVPRAYFFKKSGKYTVFF